MTLVNDTRLLTVEELYHCKECFYGFFVESNLPGKPNFMHWWGTWTQMIQKEVGYLLATIRDNQIVAVLGGLFYPCMLTGDKEMVEAFWWVKPKYRGTTIGIKLLKSFEKISKDLGVIRIKMIFMSHLNPETMKNIYTRMGYRQIEVGYMKEVA